MAINISAGKEFNVTSVNHNGDKFDVLKHYKQLSSYGEHYQITLSQPDPTVALTPTSITIMLDNPDDLARINQSFINTGKFEQPGIKIELSQPVKVSQTATTVEVAL